MKLKEKIKKKTEELKLEVTALFIALKKKQTPWYAKAIAGVTVAYALSPIDLIPDFIPLLGYLDDIIMLPLLALAAIKLIPKDLMEQCRQEAAGLWENGKPKRWYFAIPIIVFWLVIITVIILKIVL